MKRNKIKRALITVSDKSKIKELSTFLHSKGVEIVATGKTAQVIEESGIPVIPIEKVSGSPEAFQGRMKTLSFPVCSGILYRRGDQSDEKDLDQLGIVPIDCVVVNFYPFEETLLKAKESRLTRYDLIEQIDIGGPTLVRSAAKNAPSVTVLTDPQQYDDFMNEFDGGISETLSLRFASQAWNKIAAYDQAIAEEFGSDENRISLRYGENPHQSGSLEIHANSPIAWPRSSKDRLTENELSYNNILDLSSAYQLCSDLIQITSNKCSTVVIVKHNNPCGVASVSISEKESQLQALMKAWQGDPVSSFGGVLVFSEKLTLETADWLSQKFVECIAAPDLDQNDDALKMILKKRKKLKAVRINRFGEMPRQTVVSVPGGKLIQSSDSNLSEELKSVTKASIPKQWDELSQFGIAVTRVLKSNTVSLVRLIPGLSQSYQLVGAGQGQPNRVEALRDLAIPRAKSVLSETGGQMSDCILVSDAFFPFRDTVDVAAEAGIKFIIQPGGSMKDQESIDACNEHGMAMSFTGMRHFRH